MTKADLEACIFLGSLIVLWVIHAIVFFSINKPKMNANRNIWNKFIHSKTESECPLCGQKAQWDFKKDKSTEITTVVCNNCGYSAEIRVTITKYT